MAGYRPAHRSRVRGPLTVAAGLAVLAVASTPARADHHDLDVPWPQLLPALPVSAAVQPHAVKRCPQASLACVDRLIGHLRRQWRGFDRTCDHRAPIAYSYLKITQGLRRDLSGRGADLVRYRRWMIYLITTFSNRYRAAFRDYAEGRPVPAAWRITFETAANGEENAGQDVLLFSNAHVQHDLPFALAEMGLRTPAGASRKHDHDAVNKINSEVFDPIEDYFTAHYDPQFKLIDAKPLPTDEIGTLELVKSWRETAWRNAERLMNARTASERAQVVASIDRYSTAWANLIASGSFPGERAARDSFCFAHHETGG